MARRAKVMFPHSLFSNKLLDKGILEDLFDVLPVDSVMVGMNTSYNTSESFIIVESKDFIDTPWLTNLPEIIIILSGSSSGSGSNYYISSLDMSAALAQQATTCSCTGNIICNYCIQNAVNSMPAVPPPPPPNTFQVGQATVSLPKGYSCSFTSPNPVPTQGCDHDWKIYDSGFSRDEYCSKCSTKRQC